MATTKTELQEATAATKDEFRQVPQYIYDAHNQGQKKRSSSKTSESVNTLTASVLSISPDEPVWFYDDHKYSGLIEEE